MAKELEGPGVAAAKRQNKTQCEAERRALRFTLYSVRCAAKREAKRRAVRRDVEKLVHELLFRIHIKYSRYYAHIYTGVPIVEVTSFSFAYRGVARTK